MCWNSFRSLLTSIINSDKLKVEKFFGYDLAIAAVVIGIIYTFASIIVCVKCWIILLCINETGMNVNAYISWFIYGTLAVNIVDAALSGLLTFGSIKNKPAFIFPWLIFTPICMVSIIIGAAVFCIIILVQIATFSFFIAEFMIAIIYLGIFGFVTYMWMAIFTHYKAMRYQPQNPPNWTDIPLRTNV